MLPFAFHSTLSHGVVAQTRAESTLHHTASRTRLHCDEKGASTLSCDIS